MSVWPRENREMNNPIIRWLAKSVRWFTGRGGYLLLTTDDQRLSLTPTKRFTWAWLEVFVLSLLWGVLMIGLWGWAWRSFGDEVAWLLPPTLTMAASLLLMYRLAAVRTAELIATEAAHRPLLISVGVAVATAGLMALKPQLYRQEYSLPDWISWVRPMAKNYRVLLLMPLWGAWAMMIVGQFCHCRDRTEPAVAAFVKACGPLMAAGGLAAVLSLSIFYFHFLPYTHLGISGAAIAAAIAGGLLLSRRSGGLTRSSLLAANLVTQLAFLLAYLACQ